VFEVNRKRIEELVLQKYDLRRSLDKVNRELWKLQREEDDKND